VSPLQSTFGIIIGHLPGLVLFSFLSYPTQTDI